MIGKNGPGSQRGTGLGSALNPQSERNMQMYFAQHGDPARPMGPASTKSASDDKEDDVDDGDKKRASKGEILDEKTKAGPNGYPKVVLDAADAALRDDTDPTDCRAVTTIAPPSTQVEPATARRKGGSNTNK